MEELEVGKRHSQAGNETFTSSQDVNIYNINMSNATIRKSNEKIRF